MLYIALEVVQEAKWMDLLTYLKNYDPFELGACAFFWATPTLEKAMTA